MQMRVVQLVWICCLLALVSPAKAQDLQRWYYGGSDSQTPQAVPQQQPYPVQLQQQPPIQQQPMQQPPQERRYIPQQQQQQPVVAAQPIPSAPPMKDVSSADAYQLGPGDKLRVTVYEEPDLSGEFEVDGSGHISLPLIGEVNAYKQTLRGLEALVAERFRDGYLLNPRVSMEVLTFRNFFIMGEVKQPGSYPYVSALTVLNAVAVAGGYTYRAKDSDMEITRRLPDGTVQKIEANETTKVMPEDTIKIKERFF